MDSIARLLQVLEQAAHRGLAGRLKVFIGAVVLPIALVLATSGVAPASVGAGAVDAASLAVAGLSMSAADGEEGEPSAEAVALAEAVESGEPVEVRQARTETETVVASPEGTLTLGGGRSDPGGGRVGRTGCG